MTSCEIQYMARSVWKGVKLLLPYGLAMGGALLLGMGVVRVALALPAVARWLGIWMVGLAVLGALAGGAMMLWRQLRALYRDAVWHCSDPF